jgi:hypothetical protein
MVIIEPLAKKWLDCVWETHEDIFETRDMNALRKLSEIVWRNTKKDIAYTSSTTVEQYAALTSGFNLRW